jgi:DNA-binding transcriptional MerR regulator
LDTGTIQVKDLLMKISQLAAASGVSVPTIKFYLREGLLHDGLRTSATQAEYDEEHVGRLRLVRALLGPAGLSVAGTRSLLATMENPPERAHDLLGAAHAVGMPRSSGRSARDLDAVRARVLGWGWDVSDCDPAVLESLGDALDRLRDADFVIPDEVIRTYIAAMQQVATAEIAGTPMDSPEAAVRYVVLGTVLAEPVLLAFRRLAQEAASLQRFSESPLG